MARKRITEFIAKKILYPPLCLDLNGASVESTPIEENLKTLPDSDSYVAKVDQGIKKRMKNGLVRINLTKTEAATFIQETAQKNYTHFFVEKFIEHSPEEERYLSLERTREGTVIFYSKHGGIDIEEAKDSIQKKIITDAETQARDLEEIRLYLGLPENVLKTILTAFDENYFSFLEINPLVVKDSAIYVLDLAVEVDSTAEFFVNGAWSSQDFADHFSVKKTDEEKAVFKLASQSQAAFSLEVLNKNASIFVLLSGGGASLVMADEVYNLGHGKELGNYGEYSGNPSAEETYIYAKAILSLLIRSTAEKKVLLIGGGVANFTDVRATFKGIIKALNEYKSELQKQKIKVFVRRGGPHFNEGLQMIDKFLRESGISGAVYGPDIVLTKIIQEGVASI